ncbi:hypothetical protein [Clostridium beijerinckii]|uniref:Uncharacterized protein n=1 Tax=Clostridium beijerinckii TaxID=1520 RepID=A0A1S8S5Y0_CLOBE|nr:hypothetical protein [Clostridium beijerinckii]NRY60060.1 hypothetical protein [Clostridium beijerinckii]OOM60916.1 hypothetical protein CLBCK_26330 [Clostridium beijerinckii]
MKGICNAREDMSIVIVGHYETKIKLAEELVKYDKVKNNEQIKALVDFLEYLFLIQDEELEDNMKII